MMSGNEKKPPSIFSTIPLYKKSKLLNNHEQIIEFPIVRTNKKLQIPSDEQETDEDWEMVRPKK